MNSHTQLTHSICQPFVRKQKQNLFINYIKIHECRNKMAVVVMVKSSLNMGDTYLRDKSKGSSVKSNLSFPRRKLCIM